MLRFLRFFVAMILICSLAACNRDKASIIPSVNINKKSAEMGTPIEVTYSFSTKSNYVALSKEMTVFVHFIDPRGNRRFQDDHVPPKPISEWRPDGNYNYTRTVFVPKNIPAGEYSVVAGIYSPRKEERIVLQAKPYGNRSYEMGILLIEIPPQGPVAQYTSGWYALESEPNDVGTSWRWMKKEAVLKCRNPKNDALLYLKVDGVPERFSEPQKLTVAVDGHEIETFALTSNQPVSKKYDVSRSMLGNENMVEVKLAVDQSFIPANDKVSRDTRELGIRVYQLYLGKASD